MKLELLAEPNKQEIVFKAIIEAPRELIFRALTEAELIPQWWGPRVYTTDVVELDARKGGKWRFVQHDAKGDEFAFNGVFHECVAPERVTYTFEFEGMPGHVLMETVTLNEHDGRTEMTDRSVFQTIEDRDGMLSAGMESGGRESMERLEELIERLQA